MFNQIKQLQILKDNKRILLPNSHAHSAAIRLWKMSDWLYNDFVGDAAKINLENVDPMTNPSIFRSDENLDDFCIRAHCRFLSYSVIVCSLDRILEKMYADLNAHFNITPDRDTTNSRKSEIEKLRIWRDKIAAHTSYADPRKDNDALQLTSLMQFHQITWQGSPPDFTKMHFGGMSANVDGQQPSTDVPFIQWQETHEQIKEHYQKWVEMFNKITDNYKDNI